MDKICNSDQSWNNNKCQHECEKRNVCKKDYVQNPATCNCESGKYLASAMDDSPITCDEIIGPYNKDVEAKQYDETKTTLTNFNRKKATCKTQNVYI